jgi:hypothetical protein
LEQGFTGQAWPAMRAVHEGVRLLVAVTDTHIGTLYPLVARATYPVLAIAH